MSSLHHRGYNEGTPLTNLYMTMLDTLGIPVDRIGDSTGQLNGLVM